MIKIRRFETTDDLVSKTQVLLQKTLSTAGNLMLSGGSTPYIIYNQLAKTPGPVHPDRNLFLSDERMVPTDSPKNNANNLMPLLQALKCEDRFIRVNTALSIDEAAARFAVELQPLESIDLGFLGMGDDGHTAGFFTQEQANMKTGSLTLHTDRPDGMQGVSITPALLQRVQRIILLVTGESKRTIISTLLTRPETIPAGIALVDHPNIELWTDIAVS
jgi:6-phosphogluconolactonase